MAYDANGIWHDEEDSAAKRMNDLTSSSSPYIKQARQSGMETAGRRGLLNSSLAAGASQGAAIAAAQPIALADANAAAQKNLSAQGFTQQQKLNQGGYDAQMAQTLAQINSNEKLAGLDEETKKQLAQMQIDATAKQQAAQIASTEKIASQGNDAQMAQIMAQLNSNEKLAGLDNATKMQIAQMQIDVQNAQIASQEKIATQQVDAQRETALAQINSNEKLAQLDQATKLQLASLDAQTQTKIANLNISGAQQKDAISSAVSMAQVYANIVQGITSNPNIPAKNRTNLMNSAKAQLDENLGLVEQIYNINLDWGQGGGVDTSSVQPAPI